MSHMEAKESASKRVEKETGAMFEAQAFEILEREFQQVLYELQAEPSLDKFRFEYEKLHRALKKSHESEKRLIKKCRELNSEIQINTAKVHTALSNSEEDQRLILELREEMAKAWKMVDATQEKEAKARENIQALKQEIASLSGIVDQSVSLTSNQDATVLNLEEEKQTVTRERDHHIATVAELKKELSVWIEKVRSLEEQKLSFENELAAVKSQHQAKRAECDREVRKKEKLEKELRDLRLSIDTSKGQMKFKETELAQSREQANKLDMLLNEQKHIAEKAAKALDVLSTKVIKLQDDLEEQLKFNTQLLAENSERMVEMKMKDDELESVREEIIKVKKVREATLNKLRATETQKEEGERQREDLQNQIIYLQKEVEAQKRLTEHEKKRLEESIREREVLRKMSTQAEESGIKQMDILRMKESEIHNLELEIHQYKDTAAKQDQVIEHLDNERQKSAAECSASAKKYLKALDAMREMELQIVELQKNIESSQMKIKQQKALFEVVRVEKNLYSKRLVDTQDEIDEAKRKLQISNQMVKSLKDQLALMDGQLEKGAVEIAKVEREKETLNESLGILQKKVENAQSKIAEYSTRIENHDALVGQAAEETTRLRKEFNVVKIERDLLATQVMRRDEELRLVYEKVRVQQSTLEKGQIQYLARLNELRVLKLRLTDLKREYTILTGSLKNMKTLKQEIHNLGRQLTRERLKVRIMTEELETPQNVHRWRTLEATDPTVYEMITRVQTLQKRLIIKTEEVVEKDLLIQEKERLYIELQKILARQPGPEVAEKLNSYAKNISDKTRQLKAMSSELSLYQIRVKEYKSEIQDLNGQLNKFKVNFIEQKDKQQPQEKQRAKNHGPPMPSPTPKTIKSAIRVGR